ncbi:MAG: 50S ribosomal protein L34e, partial [Methanobacterium sp.]|nr:50S ribosomal protein L34e [Methanobacterium sp.]
SKTKKRPNRPYGGYLCSECARKHFKKEARS